MKLIDAKVSREDWFPLYNRGVCARVLGPTAEETMALIATATDAASTGIGIMLNGTRIDPVDFYAPTPPVTDWELRPSHPPKP